MPRRSYTPFLKALSVGLAPLVKICIIVPSSMMKFPASSDPAPTQPHGNARITALGLLILDSQVALDTLVVLVALPVVALFFARVAQRYCQPLLYFKASCATVHRVHQHRHQRTTSFACEGAALTSSTQIHSSLPFVAAFQAVIELEFTASLKVSLISCPAFAAEILSRHSSLQLQPT